MQVITQNLHKYFQVTATKKETIISSKKYNLEVDPYIKRSYDHLFPESKMMCHSGYIILYEAIISERREYSDKLL